MKSIIELFKGDAVKFFGINKRIVTAARTELTEIKIQKNIDDWVLLAEDDTYIHFEFQTTISKDDLPRFMVSDAMLYHKERKPVKTVAVYSADIEDAITTLDIGAIRYEVEAFYMAKLDGDSKYDELRTKIEAGKPLIKQDLLSIVFLPLMKNSVDKTTRLEQAITLSKELRTTDEQLQIQAMLDLLAEKFIKDKEQLSKLKELLSMTAVAEMIRHDEKIDIAKNALKEGLALEMIRNITGLDEPTIRQIQAELNNE